MNKPVICAVNGICFGGGLEIALSCDIILAADHATFALPEIRSGTVADAASHQAAQAHPYHIAMEMLFDRPLARSRRGASLGFVNHILPADRLDGEAWKMAELLASGPPLVFAAIKEVVREAEGEKFQDTMNRITKSQFETVERSIDRKINLRARAFAEKRDPVWKGR
jgi:crotonobetainyl-CoA hydratase